MLSAIFNPFDQMLLPLFFQPRLIAAGKEVDRAEQERRRQARAELEKEYVRLSRNHRRWHWPGWSDPVLAKEVQRLLDLEPQRIANALRIEKQTKHREKLHAALQHEFDAYGGRGKWIWHQRKTRTLKSIGDQIGLSRDRVNQIAKQVERRRNRQAAIRPFEFPEINKGRPIDMGGPRDVWLTFFPSPDPRLDNMEPVSADASGPRP
jgi:hypothetical protein